MARPTADSESPLNGSGVQTPPSGVSVIIPAYNEEDGVAPVVRAVREVAERAGWTDSEVIVVDDCSEDATAERALEAGARLI